MQLSANPHPAQPTVTSHTRRADNRNTHTNVTNERAHRPNRTRTRPHTASAERRHFFITDAVMNGMPPHIAQLVVGHADINTTMGYKAVYPEEAINGHRAFITRRRGLRPSEEYRTPTDEEWEEFLGHFERRKVALGDCGRAYGTSCIHEHACIRCALLRPDPAQRHRLLQVQENLQTRIDEAKREGWLGEAQGLGVSLAAAKAKLTQLDDLAARRTTIHLGMPAFPDVASATSPGTPDDRLRRPARRATRARPRPALPRSGRRAPDQPRRLAAARRLPPALRAHHPRPEQPNPDSGHQLARSDRRP